MAFCFGHGLALAPGRPLVFSVLSPLFDQKNFIAPKVSSLPCWLGILFPQNFIAPKDSPLVVHPVCTSPDHQGPVRWLLIVGNFPIRHVIIRLAVCVLVAHLKISESIKKLFLSYQFLDRILIIMCHVINNTSLYKPPTARKSSLVDFSTSRPAQKLIFDKNKIKINFPRCPSVRIPGWTTVSILPPLGPGLPGPIWISFWIHFGSILGHFGSFLGHLRSFEVNILGFGSLWPN